MARRQKAEDMTAELAEKVLTGWEVWMQSIDSVMVDIGYPMANGKAVVDDGPAGKATNLNSYSVIEAKDMDAGLQLVGSHPFLNDKSGKFKIEVFERLPRPI